MHRPVALICDGDEARRDHVAAALRSSGCTIHRSTSIDTLPSDAARHHPSVVVIAFGDGEATQALGAVGRIHSGNRRVAVLFITRAPSDEMLLSALRAGVKDFFREPLDAEAVAACVGRVLHAGEGRATAKRQSSGEQAFIGTSRAMRSIGEYLARVAQHDATVLITGETGTGKELAAARIHDQSARRAGRFVSVNCAAIPEALLESELFGHESGAFTGATRTREGLLQLANRGTVFLDEVGDLGLQAQAKILRALESREVYRVGGSRPEKLDVRVVAATNQDLERALDEGRFRKDLYFRLNVARVHLPPLRERRGDIGPLLEHYLAALRRNDSATAAGFSDEALAALEAYDWPGNIRELRNLVEAIFVSPPVGDIAIADLPENFRQRLQQVAALPETERRRLLDALLTAKWNKSRAASILHCSRMTLYRKMAKYSVVASDDARITVSHRGVTPPRRKTPA